jgi:hypothetical protein
MSRKVFTAGEVLAAADVNSFLMDQTIMSFAGTAARGSAIPTPVEGMTTFLEDSNLLEMYDGSAYKQISGLTGGILQVVTGTTSTGVTTTSGTFSDTGLTATITPKRATSKILILTQQNHQLARDAVVNVEMETRLVRDSTTLTNQRIGYNDNAGNTYRVFYGITAYSVVDSPNTTSAVTYKTQQSSSSGCFANSNFNSYPSTITLLELAG